MSFCCYHLLTPLSSKSQRLQLHLQCQLLADVALSYPIFPREKFGRHKRLRFSRTQAVPFSGLEDPGSPSERIASSFTGTASRLTWRPCQVHREIGYTDIWWGVGYEMIWHDFQWYDYVPIAWTIFKVFCSTWNIPNRVTLFRKWPAAFGLCSMFCDWKSCAVIHPYLWMASIKVQIGQLTYTIPIADNGQWYL